MTGYGVTNDWISEYEKFLDRKLKRFTLKVNLSIILYTPPVHIFHKRFSVSRGCSTANGRALAVKSNLGKF